MRCFRKYRYLLSIPLAVSFQATGEQPVPGMPVSPSMQYMPAQNGMHGSYNNVQPSSAYNQASSGYQANPYGSQPYSSQSYNMHGSTTSSMPAQATMPEPYNSAANMNNNMDMNTGQMMPQQHDSYSGYQGMGNTMPQEIPQVINNPVMTEDHYGYQSTQGNQYNPYSQGSQPQNMMGQDGMPAGNMAQQGMNPYNSSSNSMYEQPHSTFNMQTGERIDNHRSMPDSDYNMNQPVAGSYEPDHGMLTQEEMQAMPPQGMEQYSTGNQQPYADYSAQHSAPAQQPYHTPNSGYSMPEQSADMTNYNMGGHYKADNYSHQPDSNYMGMPQQDMSQHNFAGQNVSSPSMGQHNNYNPPSANMMPRQNGYSYQSAPTPEQPSTYSQPAYNSAATQQPAYNQNQTDYRQPDYQKPQMQHHASQWRSAPRGMNTYQQPHSNTQYRNNSMPARQPSVRQPLGMTVMAPQMMSRDDRCQQIRRRRHIEINTVPGITPKPQSDDNSCFKPDENLFYSAIMSAQQKMGPNSPWYHQLRMETDDRTTRSCNAMYNNAPADPRAIMMCRQQQFDVVMRPYEARYEDESIFYLRQRKQLAEQLFFQCKGALASRRSMIPSGITLPIAYNNNQVNAFPSRYVEKNLEKDLGWAKNLYKMRANELMQETLGAFCPGEMVYWITI